MAWVFLPVTLRICRLGIGFRSIRDSDPRPESDNYESAYTKKGSTRGRVVLQRQPCPTEPQLWTSLTCDMKHLECHWRICANTRDLVSLMSQSG